MGSSPCVLSEAVLGCFIPLYPVLLNLMAVIKPLAAVTVSCRRMTEVIGSSQVVSVKELLLSPPCSQDFKELENGRLAFMERFPSKCYMVSI